MKLFPRFSLRTVWIVLTIFLIAFGVSVNYYQRYQAHEQIATKLQNLDYQVEETTSKFLGYTLSKTLVGLESPQPWSNEETMTVLRELPRPRDLLWFANLNRIRNQAQLDLLLEAIAQFTNLEELYLEDLIFTKAQFARLGSLTQLRVLSLKECNIPPGGLEILALMPRLEKLLLPDSKFPSADLLAQPLPALRILDLSNSPVTELPLTKSGWGKSPTLETILLGQATLARVTCEAGALPNLRRLDLAYQGGTLIDWPALPTAAPNLDTLALHISQLSGESAPALRKFSQLRYLHLNQDPVNGIAEDRQVTVLLNQPELPANGLKKMLDDIVVPVAKESLARELVKDRPQLLFCRDYGVFYELINPGQLSNSYGHPWASTNWRPQAVADPFAPTPGTPGPTVPVPLSVDPFGDLAPAPTKPFDDPVPQAIGPFGPSPLKE